MHVWTYVVTNSASDLSYNLCFIVTGHNFHKDGEILQIILYLVW